MADLAALAVSRRIRDAHQEEVNKIVQRNDAHFRRQAEQAKQERLRVAARHREREANEQRQLQAARERQAREQQRAAEMFARHDDGSGLLGPEALRGLLAEALPLVGLPPPDAHTVGVLLRRAELEGITSAGEGSADGGGLGCGRDPGRRVALAGVSTILLKYRDYLREQSVLDEAFAGLACGGVMDGAALLALLRELAPERGAAAADVHFVLRASGDARLAGMTPNACGIQRAQMRLLVPAIAAWLRREPKSDGPPDEPLQGEPVPPLAGSAATRTLLAPAGAPRSGHAVAVASGSSCCTVL